MTLTLLQQFGLLLITNIILISSLFLDESAYGEIIYEKSGTINELLVDKNNVYFFERDPNITSPNWIPDTRVMVIHNEEISRFSNQLFIFPTELTEYQDFIYFAKLSKDCEEEIICNYQDLVKMSKLDRSIKIIASDLKSAIHISVEDDGIYLSESSGKIWHMDHDGSARKLLAESGNIIMDITSTPDAVYWIEEIEDQNNSIIMLKKTESIPKIIASDLQIPYDLKEDHGVFWNEIYIQPDKGLVSEFTKITEYSNGKSNVIAELRNTTPFSHKSNIAHHEPYLIVGDYLFFVNNTDANFSTLQMRTVQNGTDYELHDVKYDVKFMRAGSDFLYMVGNDRNGFVIDKITLPVEVPEFPILFMVTFTSFVIALGIIFTRRQLFRM